jgi:ParB family transcriptional regulator, chromosome partitioning protein
VAINKRHLGRGLDSLLPQNFDNSLLLSQDERIQKLLVKNIKPNPDQPRKEFDRTALEELAASIAQYGVLQPIIVSPDKDGYQIIAGERRWRASQVAGQTTIPAIVREKAEIEQLEIALIENVQRVDLSPLEQAISIERLHQQFNLSYKEISKKLGKAAPTVNNIVRLLQLPTSARDALQSGKISEGHARAILALKDLPAAQHRLLELIQSQVWSVRQAERFVSAHKQGLKTHQATTKRVARETAETKALSQKLGAKTTIYHTAKGGRLEIHFKNDQELAKLYNRLDKI